MEAETPQLPNLGGQLMKHNQLPIYDNDSSKKSMMMSMNMFQNNQPMMSNNNFINAYQKVNNLDQKSNANSYYKQPEGFKQVKMDSNLQVTSKNLLNLNFTNNVFPNNNIGYSPNQNLTNLQSNDKK